MRLLCAVRRNTCTGQRGYGEEKFVHMTSCISGMNETGECEKSFAAPFTRPKTTL